MEIEILSWEQPHVVPLADRRFALAHPMTVVFRERGVEYHLTVPEGDETDLTTVPMPLEPVFPRDGVHRCAVVTHDYLCKYDGDLPEGCLQYHTGDGWKNSNRVFTPVEAHTIMRALMQAAHVATWRWLTAFYLVWMWSGNRW